MPECVFCAKIAARDYERLHGRVVSFTPLHPVTEGHRLFVPIAHAKDATWNTRRSAAAFEAAAEWAAHTGDDANIITSIGAAATQTVFHTHIHYVPRRPGDGLHLPWTGQKRDTHA